MSFRLEIQTDNDAFVGITGPTEVARILHKVESQVTYGQTQGTVMDVNGNTVGSWSMDPLPGDPVDEYLDDAMEEWRDGR